MRWILRGESTDVKISQLTIYPVKSCKGIDVQTAVVTETGLAFDRAFCVIDKDGEFISQRTVPELALIETEFRGGFDDDDDDENVTLERLMTLRGRNIGGGGRKGEIGFKESKLCRRVRNTIVSAKRGRIGRSGVCCVGLLRRPRGREDAGNEWISRAIRVPGAKIVRWIGSGGIPERFNKNVSTSDRNSRPARPLDERYAKNGGETAFSDGYPVLLAHAASLNDLQKRVLMGKDLFNLAGSEVKMNRFRPNVVVSGGKEWVEDTWLKIETSAGKKNGSEGGDGGVGVGGGAGGGMEEEQVTWDLVKPCSRCTIPDINQETGIFDKNREVSRALQKFRSGTVLNSQTKTWANEVFRVERGTEQNWFHALRRRYRDHERAQTNWCWFHVIDECYNRFCYAKNKSIGFVKIKRCMLFVYIKSEDTGKLLRHQTPFFLSFFLSFFTRVFARVKDDAHILHSQDIRFRAHISNTRCDHFWQL